MVTDMHVQASVETPCADSMSSAAGMDLLKAQQDNNAVMSHLIDLVRRCMKSVLVRHGNRGD